jgi:hypothetical protein
MRRTLLIALSFWLLPAGGALAEGDFPYRAYITGDDVYVRSGPGKNYYPTAKLQAGQLVEVYRHDPGGWYAVRPPEGSHSWVSTRYLKPTGDGLAEVTGDRVAARVGSAFSDIREVVQVRLQQGELVELLEEKPSPGSSEAKGWYKIAPPSGEFRWVYGKYVDPDYPADGVRQASIEGNPLVDPAGAASARDSQVYSAEHNELLDESRAASEGPAYPGSAEDAADRSYSTDREPLLAGGDERAVARGSMRHLSPEEFDQEVVDLEMDLSIMVAEEPTVWTFDRLALRADQLLGQAETALERGRARMLANKIARFDQIKQSYDAVASTKTDIERRNRQLAALGTDRTERRTHRASDDRFDGTGRLARVVSRDPSAPRYALVDQEGRVRAYVDPVPGLNLRHYVGKEIGITGARGFAPDRRAPVIMTKHITPLGSGMLR